MHCTTRNRVAPDPLAVDRDVQPIDAIAGDANVRCPSEAVRKRNAVAAALAARRHSILNYREAVCGSQIEVRPDEGQRAHWPAIRCSTYGLHDLSLVGGVKRRIQNPNDIAVLKEPYIKIAIRTESNRGRQVPGQVELGHQQSTGRYKSLHRVDRKSPHAREIQSARLPFRVIIRGNIDRLIAVVRNLSSMTEEDT